MGAVHVRVPGARVVLVRRLLLLAGVLAFLPLGAACGGLSRSSSLPDLTGAPAGMDDFAWGAAAQWVGKQILGAVIGKATGLGCDWLISMAGLSPSDGSGAQLDAITQQLDRLQSSVDGLHAKLDAQSNKLDEVLLILKDAQVNSDYQRALQTVMKGWINYQNGMATVEAFQNRQTSYDGAQQALNDWAAACNINGPHPLSTVLCELDAMLMSSAYGEPRVRKWCDDALHNLQGQALVPTDESLAAQYFQMAGLFLYVVERERQACQMLEEALKLNYGRPSSRQAADAGAAGASRASVGGRPAMGLYPGAPTAWLAERLGEQTSAFLQQVERLVISTANYRSRLDDAAADPPFLREIATCDKGILWHAHYIAGQIAPDRFDTATVVDGHYNHPEGRGGCLEVIGEDYFVEDFARNKAPALGYQVVRFGGDGDNADVRYYPANLYNTTPKAFIEFRGAGGSLDPNLRNELYPATRVAAAMFRVWFREQAPPINYPNGDPGMSINSLVIPARYYNSAGEEYRGGCFDEGERWFGSATAVLRSTPKLRTASRVYYRTENASETEARVLPVTTNDSRVWQYKDWARIPGHRNDTAVTQVAVQRADLFSGSFESQRGSAYAELVQYWTIRDVCTSTNLFWRCSGLPDLTSSDQQFSLTLKAHLDHTVTLYNGVDSGNASKCYGGYTNQIKGTLFLESPSWLGVFTTAGPLESRVDCTEARSADKYLELTRSVGSTDQSLSVGLTASLKIRNLAGDMFWRRCGYEWAPRFVIIELTPN